MNTRELTYIITIAEEKNLSRAAEKLYISQSALSQHLRKVEESINAPVFKYTNKKMELTDAGRIYLNGVRNIIALNREMEEELSKLR